VVDQEEPGPHASHRSSAVHAAPAVPAVSELMRVLMDQEKLGWTKAWDLVTEVGGGWAGGGWVGGWVMNEKQC
jgi:hypothetical protein